MTTPANMPTAAHPIGKRFTSTIDQAVLIGAINQYGDGGHPAADTKTLPFFDRDYVIACVRKARPHLTTAGQSIAVQLIYRLEAI